jgi:hypothetical protein
MRRTSERTTVRNFGSLLPMRGRRIKNSLINAGIRYIEPAKKCVLYTIAGRIVGLASSIEQSLHSQEIGEFLLQRFCVLYKKHRWCDPKWITSRMKPTINRKDFLRIIKRIIYYFDLN